MISIVVSMYNSKPEIIELLDKLFFPSLINNASPQKQFILIDDASPLASETKDIVNKYRTRLESNFGDFQFHKNDRNLGFSNSYNKGIKLAGGDVVMILNDDIYLPQCSVDALCEVLKSNKDYGAVGPVTNHAGNFQNTKLFEGIKDYSAQELLRVEHFAKWLRDVMAGKVYEVTEWGLFGFCLAIHKSTLNDVGYFDERYEYGNFEDIDLNRRIKAYAKKLILDASTFVVHRGPDLSLSSMMQNKWKYNKSLYINRLRYAKRWNDYSGAFLQMIIGYAQLLDIGTVTRDIKKEAKRKDLWETYKKEIKASPPYKVGFF